MGWDPETKEVYFRISGHNESGLAPTIVRLPLRRSPLQFDVLPWSAEADWDSAYGVQVHRLEPGLAPLEEATDCSTVPDMTNVLESDSVGNDWYPARRYRIRARFRCVEGWIEAIVFREPSIRLLRLYRIPGERIAVGIFSYVGIPHEGGYEVQVPVALTRTEYNGVLEITPFWAPRLRWWSGPEAIVRSSPHPK